MLEKERIEILRNVSKAVKTFPFLYTALLLLLSPLEAWLSLRWSEVLGLLTFTSMPSVWLCWRLSRAVKLCPWHRVQCFIMLLPLFIPLCRILKPEVGILWVWCGVAVLLIASLINCYFVFIKPTARR